MALLGLLSIDVLLHLSLVFELVDSCRNRPLPLLGKFGRVRGELMLMVSDMAQSTASLSPVKIEPNLRFSLFKCITVY